MTLLEKYYEWNSVNIQKLSFTPAEEIAFGIFSDITGRKGLGNELESVEEDIQNEILQEWIEIANKQVNKI